MEFQLGAIVVGLNAVAIILLFPETAYSRNYVTGTEPIDTTPENTEKKSEVQEVQVVTSDPTRLSPDPMTQQRRKSYLQELKPWSGINRNASLFNLMLRPWPLVVYPVVIYALLIYSAIL